MHHGGRRRGADLARGSDREERRRGEDTEDLRIQWRPRARYDIRHGSGDLVAATPVRGALHMCTTGGSWEQTTISEVEAYSAISELLQLAQFASTDGPN
jgi:hypothetical protein